MKMKKFLTNARLTAGSLRVTNGSRWNPSCDAVAVIHLLCHNRYLSSSRVRVADRPSTTMSSQMQLSTDHSSLINDAALFDEDGEDLFEGSQSPDNWAEEEAALASSFDEDGMRMQSEAIDETGDATTIRPDGGSSNSDTSVSPGVVSAVDTILSSLSEINAAELVADMNSNDDHFNEDDALLSKSTLPILTKAPSAPSFASGTALRDARYKNFSQEGEADSVDADAVIEAAKVEDLEAASIGAPMR